MRYLIGFLLTFFILSVCQAKIVTVAVDMAGIQSRPADVATYVVLQAPRYYPLSVQGEQNNYYQVRDYQGRLGWLHKSLASDKKGVVIEVDRANVRKGPNTKNPIVFHAYKGVTFKVLGEKEGWLEVVHEGGGHGWISKSLTWGQ